MISIHFTKLTIKKAFHQIMTKKFIALLLYIIPLILVGTALYKFLPRFLYEIIPAWLITLLIGLCFTLSGYAIDHHFNFSRIVPLKISWHFFAGSVLFLIILIFLLFTHLFYPKVIIACLIIIFLVSSKYMKTFLNDFKCFLSNLNFKSILTIQFITIFIAASTPPYFFDALLYQLAIPADYLRNHGFTYNPYSILTSYPMNANLFFSIPLSLHSDMAAQLISFLFTIFGCITIKEFIEQHLDSKAASLATVIYLTTPVISITSLIPLIDTILAYYSLLTFILLFHYCQSNKNSLFYLACCAAGIAFGIKHTFIPFILPLSLLTFLTFQKEKKLASRFFSYIKFILLSGIITSPWLIKNLFVYGNPFYPYFSKIIDSQLEIERILMPTSIPFATFLKQYLTLPITMHFKLLGSAGILGCFFIAMLPWLFLLTKQYNSLFRYCLILSIVGLIIFIFLPHSLRYFLPVFPLLCILYGIGLNFNNDFISKAGKTIAFLCIFTNMIILVNYCTSFHLFNYSLKQEDKTTFLGRFIEYYNAADYLNKNGERNANVLLIGEDRTFYFKNKCYSNWLVQRPHLIERWLRQAGSADNLASLLKAKNVKYILFNYYGIKQHPDNLKKPSFYSLSSSELNIFNEFQNKYLTPFYQDQFITIFSIRLTPNHIKQHY